MQPGCREIAAGIARDKTLLKSDLEDRQEAIDEVRALFAEYTQVLYGRLGRLGVGPRGLFVLIHNRP